MKNDGWMHAKIIAAINFLTTKLGLTLDGILRTVQVACLVAVGISALVLFYTSATLNGWNEMHKEISKDLTRINTQYRQTLVNDRYEIMGIHSRALRDRITEEIEKEYQGKHSDLKHDLETYITKNDNNNRLFQIFNDCSFEYLDKWFENRSDIRVIIMSRDHIMFSSQIKEPVRVKNQQIPDIVFERPEHMVLLVDSEGSIMAEYVSILVNHLADHQNSYMLAPSYIYEHEDLLGIRDVLPNGERAKNGKLAVVLAYKPVNDYHMHVLQHTKDTINEHVNSKHVSEATNSFIIVCICFIVFIISGTIWGIVGDEIYRDDDDI